MADLTDRELLEAASKAAGLKARFLESHAPGLKLFGEDRPWNPLADDGDALRLAGRLRLSVVHSTCGAAMCMSHDGSVNLTEQPGKGYGEDHYAATRRAIVRAAAAMATA